MGEGDDGEASAYSDQEDEEMAGAGDGLIKDDGNKDVKVIH